jgi:hypothetical protein
MLAVTAQVPVLVLDSAETVMAQPVAVPFTAVNVTAPVPDPPEVVKVSGVPNVPDVDVMVSAACAALAMVTVVAADDATR